MPEQSEIYDIKFLKGFVRRRKKVFLAVASIIFTTAVVAAYVTTTKVYISSATILIEGRTPEEMLKGVTTGHIEERLQSITQMILTREKLSEIIRQFKLYNNPGDQEGLEAAIKKMREDIAVRTIKADDLDRRPGRSRPTTVAFTLSFQGIEPQTVQKVADRLASLYVEKNEEAKEHLATQKTAVLQQRLLEMKDQSDILERKLSDFKRQHAGEMPETMSFNVEQINRLNIQLEELNAKIAVLEHRGTGSEGQFGPLAGQGTAGSGQQVSAPWAHLAQLRMQLVNLRSKYSEKHPDVIKTRKEIEQMEQKLGVTGDREGSAGNPRESELKRYTRQRDSVQRKIAELTRKNQVAPLIQAEYNRLLSDYDGVMRQYNEAKMKLAEARVVKKVDETQLGERFVVIDPPVVPQKPENPKRGKIILAGFFLSLFGGLFASILMENLDHSIKSAEHLQKMTRLPVLTVIPLIQDDEEKANSGMQKAFKVFEGFRARALRLVAKEKGL